MREELHQNNLKAKLHQDKYNTAQQALLQLGANEETFEWKEMKDEHLRCMEDPEEEKKRKEWEEKRQQKRKKNLEQRIMEDINGPGTGEGFRQLSWIWEGAGRDPDTTTGSLDGMCNGK